MKRALVFDTETTGLLLPSTADLKDQPRIIEVGLILIVLEPKMDFNDQFVPKIRSEKSWLINPGVPLTDEITKITGIKEDDLRGKPSFAEVLPEIIDVFIGAHQFIAHNMPFDLGMLVTELRRLGREHSFPFPPDQLCTVSAYAHLKGHNLKLPDLWKHIMGTEMKQTHRALEDARALAEIVIKEGLA